MVLAVIVVCSIASATDSIIRRKTYPAEFMAAFGA